MKVLVIDDIETHRLLIKQILEQYLPDVVVEMAQDGYQGMNKIDVTTDIVITDIGMPGMSGFDLARQIKWMKELQDIPIIFTTADYQQEEFVDEGYAIGAVDYLMKPVEPNSLINKVKLHYKLASAQKELVSLNEGLELRVQEKIKELAEKNKLLLQQSKLVSLGNMFSILLQQISKPIDNMIYLSTSMHFEGNDVGQSGVQPFCFTELQELSQIVADFRKLVNDNKLQEEISVKEKLEQAIRASKATLSSNGVKVYVEGDYDIKITGNTHDFVMPMKYMLASLGNMLISDDETRKEIEIGVTVIGNEVLIKLRGLTFETPDEKSASEHLSDELHVSMTIIDEVLCGRTVFHANNGKHGLDIIIPSVSKPISDAFITRKEG